MAASDERLAGGTRAAASYPMDADQSDSLAFDSVANRWHFLFCFIEKKKRNVLLLVFFIRNRVGSFSEVDGERRRPIGWPEIASSERDVVSTASRAAVPFLGSFLPSFPLPS